MNLIEKNDFFNCKNILFGIGKGRNDDETYQYTLFYSDFNPYQFNHFNTFNILIFLVILISTIKFSSLLRKMETLIIKYSINILGICLFKLCFFGECMNDFLCNVMFLVDLLDMMEKNDQKPIFFRNDCVSRKQ